MSTTPVQTFELLLETNDSLLLIDKKSKIMKIEWHGHVQVETASNLLTRGADLIEKDLCNKILLDRKNLQEFTKEARGWIKEDFLKKRAKELVHKVEKVATVKSATKIGNMFATILSTAIKLIFPGLKMNNFESEEDALVWLTN